MNSIPTHIKIIRAFQSPKLLAPLAFLGGVFWIQTVRDNLNSSKVNSQLMKALLLSLKYDDRVIKVLGGNVHRGDSFVGGFVNHIKGSSDLQFELVGEKRRGKVRFQGVRYKDSECWIPFNFELICDDGSSVKL